MTEIHGTARVRDGSDLPCRIVVEADDHADLSTALVIDFPPGCPQPSHVDIDYLYFPPDHL